MGAFPEGQSVNPEAQAGNLVSGAERFIEFIKSLPEPLFLKKMNGWAPRDVMAHLIGWNLYTIDGSRQMIKGETPAFFIDPGEDFSKVNAVLVQKYNSEEKDVLIGQMKESADKLKNYLITLDTTAWQADCGVTYNSEPVTVKNTVEALILDYYDHMQQIEKWAENTGR